MCFFLESAEPYLLVPAEYSAIATGRVGTREVHRIRTACGRTLSYIAMGAHGHKHELMVQVVLPQEHLSLLDIGSETDITCETIACAEDITSVGTLENHLTLSFVDHLETGLSTLVGSVGIIQQTMLQSHHRLLCSQVDDNSAKPPFCPL